MYPYKAKESATETSMYTRRCMVCNNVMWFYCAF